MTLVGDVSPRVVERTLGGGGKIAAAMVRGYQGDDLTKENTILSCLKSTLPCMALPGGRS